MAKALIGFTGFIGGNLAAQHRFDDLYNSTNVESLHGRMYDLIVCAGAPGRKWLANRDPDADRQSIDRLTAALDGVRADHLILISTVDVYPSPIDVDESTTIDNAANDAYGRHRYMLEEFVADRFAATIVRLPGLFGPGLKKNVIWDFLHGNRLDLIHPASMFQFYGLSDLWRDIGVVRAAGLELINFATAPLSVAELAMAAFGTEFHNEPPTPPAHYDVRSRHAALFGGTGGYIRDREQVLAAMQRFVATERRA